MLFKTSVIVKLNVLVGLLFAGMCSVAGVALYALNGEQVGSSGNTQVIAALFALLIAVFTGLAIFVRLLVRQAMLRPIRAAAHVVGRVAAGDLTVKVGVVAHGETQKLIEAIEAMVRDLGSLVSAVLSTAHTVADTTEQIAQGNLDLSQRTEEQASTLEQTSSSLDALTSTVQHNANNAKLANQLATGASEVARKGGEAVAQVVSTMTAISGSSRKIAEIISVIDGIAFQTNILSLNAAVEAARAGEHGRGFAVVASEVRSLAQRSAAAAREIKQLIGASVGEVDAGTKLVGAAGKTMAEIVTSVKQVSDLIAEIAAASQEQSVGIEYVNTAVMQMDQVVQQNASLVEEATAATESLKEQAESLLQMVSRFQLAGDKRADALTPITLRSFDQRSDGGSRPLVSAVPARPALPHGTSRFH